MILAIGASFNLIVETLGETPGERSDAHHNPVDFL